MLGCHGDPLENSKDPCQDAIGAGLDQAKLVVPDRLVHLLN